VLKYDFVRKEVEIGVWCMNLVALTKSIPKGALFIELRS